MLQFIIHYGLHFVAPVFIALIFYKQSWQKTYALLLATMLVDADHLLATPIFDPNRCSVGFHLLHSYYAIGAYFFIFIFSKHSTIRIITLGLLFHMFTDTIDCLMTRYW